MREQLAKVIYEAKKEDAWGTWKSQYRLEWPKTKKELRTRLHVGDCDLEFAFAQADAVLSYFNDNDLVVVPRSPTNKMLAAAKRPMENYRKDDEYFTNTEKHTIRYQAMILALDGEKHPLLTNLPKEE